MNPQVYAVNLALSSENGLTGIQEIKEKILVKRIMLISDRQVNVDSKTKWHLALIITAVIVAILGLTEKLKYNFNKSQVCIAVICPTRTR